MDIFQRISWSELPLEILDLVLQRLGLPDYLNFGKVCTSWRSVFLDRCNLSKPPPCLLVFPSYSSRTTMSLWSLYRDRFVKIRSPRLEFLPTEMLIGSSMGWLVLASNQKPYTQLMNPTSHERIVLPNSAAGHEVRRCFGTRGSTSSTFWLREIFLSSDPTIGECNIAASGRYSFAWCKLGDLNWSICVLSADIIIKDMAFHKGELHILGAKGDILVYSLGPQPKLIEKASMNAYTNFELCGCWRLVEPDGELLSVAFEKAKDGMVYIFKKCDDGSWERMKSLDDRVLLIDNNKGGTLSFSTRNLMGLGFEANCVYYHSNGNTVRLVKFCVADRSKKRIKLPYGGTNFLRGLTAGYILPQAW